jgi:SAM-dependent methyltransferase
MAVQTGEPQVAPVFDETKLSEFIGRAVADWGALGSAALVRIGDRLGLYDALAEAGSVTSAELAARTGTVERYVREWLLNQAASGTLTYEPASGRYGLPLEHAAALPNLVGGYELFLGAIRAEKRIADAFRTGGGLRWGEHDPDLFEGTERFFRPGYEQNLVQSWLPALDGVVAKLEAGASVADVGCGHGASTIILGQAYPRSRIVGYDNHPPSIERGREAALAAGLGERVHFEVAGANMYPAPVTGYDLIAFFDCVHDLDDPVGAARRARESLAPDGTVMMVEPMAGARAEDNFNPLGRVFSAASVLICTSNSLAGHGPALGTLATDDQLRDVFATAGFTRFRRATETPFNRIFEARP